MRITQLLIVVTLVGACGRTATRSGPSMPAPTVTAEPVATPIMLRGHISYPEKVALAPTVVVRIQVVDRTPGTGKDSIVATSEMRPEGKQAPLAYLVSVPRAALRAGRRYVLHVRITEGKVLRFITKKEHAFDVAHVPSRLDIQVNAVPQRLW
jgi:uncharacterized lipoprotein YbaY